MEPFWRRQIFVVAVDGNDRLDGVRRRDVQGQMRVVDTMLTLTIDVISNMDDV